MVNYIFKNSALLSNLKDSVKDLVANFEEVEMLMNIAENFAQKKDYQTSEDIYNRILEIEPDNDKAIRKSKHFLAMRDPLAVRYEDLPPITLVTEQDKLRQYEVDYLQYKSSLTRATSSLALPGALSLSETSRVIKKDKKTRKRKIRWPKGFDPRKPGAMPDGERWINKLDRIKGRKKKGYNTATQGTSNVDYTSTRGNLQQGPSTANIDASSSKRGKNKK